MRWSGGLRMSEQRKLATIMAVDVAGYSRAAEVDERAAAQAVSRVRAAIDDAIALNGGRVFNTAGDGFMIEFSSAPGGVAAARALLTLVRERAATVAHRVTPGRRHRHGQRRPARPRRQHRSAPYADGGAELRRAQPGC